MIKNIIEKLEKYKIKLPAYYYQNKKGSANNIDSEKSKDMPGITVITSTIRPEFMENVFENYNKQTYRKKEFILVLNKNSMNIQEWKKKAKQYSNIRIFQIDEGVGLGDCYNFCVRKSKYDYITTFDDDDYYAPNYLNDIVEAFQVSKADVVGKKARYVYLENSGILALATPLQENCYVDFIDGPTLSFNKKIFDRVRFTDMECGIDLKFCEDCTAKGIKIYSTNRFNHVYIRHSSSHNHTWVVSDEQLLGWCQVIGQVENYKEYVARQN